jgi:hypothetical protein
MNADTHITSIDFVNQERLIVYFSDARRLELAVADLLERFADRPTHDDESDAFSAGPGFFHG